MFLDRLTRRYAPAAAAVVLASTLTAQITPPADDVIILDPFRVDTTDDRSYVATEAHTGTIIAVARDLIPFNTSVITSEMIQDLAIDNASDISEYLAGVSRSTNPGISDENGQASLNFRVRGFVSQPLYNGFQTGGRIFSPDNLGRVEASKGPNAVLYGQAPAGGIINFIPKSPRFTDHASITAGFGTNAYSKFAFDLGGAIDLANVPGDLAVRLGGSLLNFEREQIFFESETASLLAALTWRMDRVAIDVRSEYTKLDVVPSRTAAFVSVGAGPARVVDPFNRLRNDRNFSYNGPHSRNKTDNYLTTIHGTFNISDSLTLRIGGFASEQWADIFLLSGPFGLGTTETVTNARYVKDDNYRKTTALKGDLLWQTGLGAWSIDSLLGYEAHWERADLVSIRTPANIRVSIPFSRRPIAGDYQAPPPLSGFSELSNSQRAYLSWTNLRFTQFVKHPEERATVMWGIARGEGDTFTRDRRLERRAAAEGEKTTYTLGGTTKIYSGSPGAALNQVIAFGNYSTSFNIQGGNAQDPSKFQGFTSVAALTDFTRSVSPNAIAPQEGKGFEVGVRSQWLDGKFNLTALYFDQTNENIARSFFVRESNAVGSNSETVIATFQLAGGEENARGVEFEMDWRPIPQLMLTASAQLTDGEVKRNPEAPEEVGFGLVQSPETMYSLMGRYDFSADSFVSGLSLGLGLSYNSSTRIRPEIGDRFRVSDKYTNVRAFARYTFDHGRLNHSVALNVENLLDQEYTQEENFLSEPRLYRLSYRLSF